MEETETTNILGLWRHPNADGKTLLPASKRRGQAEAATPLSMSTSTCSSGGDYIDLEKGSVAEPTRIDLAPASNPPPNTLYHYCPPLLIFRVRSTAEFKLTSD